MHVLQIVESDGAVALFLAVRSPPSFWRARVMMFSGSCCSSPDAAARGVRYRARLGRAMPRARRE